MRKGFKEIIKNNEYNNISIRIINDTKKAGVRKVIDHNQNKNKNKNISVNIPYNHLNYYNGQNNTTSTTSSVYTIPNSNRQNKIIFGTGKNSALINKISSENLKKISKKLKEIKHYGSSSNFKRGENKNHHTIFISKKEDSTVVNLNKNRYDATNNGYTQIKPVNQLRSHNSSNAAFLKNLKEPETRKGSLIYSVNNITQNINNKNIINNYIFESNTYRNPYVKTPNFKYYNEFMTYNSNNTNNNYIKKRNNDDNNNKIYYNNTLTTINEIKNGNLLSYRLNRKDLENMKNSKKLSTNNSSRGENLIYNPLKNKSFINEIPKSNFIRYGSKDRIFEKTNPKLNINFTKINYVKDNRTFKNIIRVSSSPKDNILEKNRIENNNINDIKLSNVNQKNIGRKENNKSSNDITNGIINKNYTRDIKEKERKEELRPLYNKANLKELINKSVDNKDNKRTKINTKINDIRSNIHIIKEFSREKYDKNKENGEYINNEIKEEEKEESFNKNEGENSKSSNNSGNKENEKNLLNTNDYQKILVKKKLNTQKNRNIRPNINNKTFSLRKEEPLDSVRKNKHFMKKKILLNLEKKLKTETKEKEEKKINNIYHNPGENKKNSEDSKEESDSKFRASEKIKSIIMGKNYDTLKKKTRISLTAKKDFSKFFNPEPNDSNSINKINTKHINYKGIKYRLISSLSVKDQLRKYILGRKKNLDKSINKYQYNDDDDKSYSNFTHTARKENTINNYTYLELKDIKNIKRDTFITLHSIGGIRNDSRFEDFEPSSTMINLKEKEFTPFVSTHPEKKFKKRGLSRLKGKSERKIRGIKIEGNTDNIEYYPYNRLNLSSFKNKNPFLGRSTTNIFNRIKKAKANLSKQYSERNLRKIFKGKFDL